MHLYFSLYEQPLCTSATGYKLLTQKPPDYKADGQIGGSRKKYLRVFGDMQEKMCNFSRTKVRKICVAAINFPGKMCHSFLLSGRKFNAPFMP